MSYNSRRIGIKFSNMKRIRYLSFGIVTKNMKYMTDFEKGSLYKINLYGSSPKSYEYYILMMMYHIIVGNAKNYSFLDYQIDEIYLDHENINNKIDISRFSKKAKYLSQLVKFFITENLSSRHMEAIISNIILNRKFDGKTILKMKNKNYNPIKNEENHFIYLPSRNYNDIDFCYSITNKKIDDDIIMSLFNGSNVKIIGQL